MAGKPTHVSTDVIVLGSSGFLGSWTVRALVGEGARCTVLVRPHSDLWRIEGVAGVDVLRAEPEDWPEAIRGRRPSAVLSLEWAGVAGAAKNDDAQWHNLPRQQALVEAARDAGVERFVGVGSQAEYGPHDGPIDESAAASPRTVYGQAKLQASLRLKESLGGHASWAWARVFSTFGALDNPHWLLPGIIDRLCRDEDAPVSIATQPWSYLSGPDAGRAFGALARSRSDGVFNLGHPEAPQLRTFIEGVAKRVPSRGTVRYGAIPLGADAVRHLQPVTRRLESTGWRPRFALEDALDWTTKWFCGERVFDPLNSGTELPLRAG